jgi:hypothetical protein
VPVKLKMRMKFFRTFYNISISRVRLIKVKTLDSAKSENKGLPNDEGTYAANQKTGDKEVEFDLGQFIEIHRTNLKQAFFLGAFALSHVPQRGSHWKDFSRYFILDTYIKI